MGLGVLFQAGLAGGEGMDCGLGIGPDTIIHAGEVCMDILPGIDCSSQNPKFSPISWQSQKMVVERHVVELFLVSWGSTLAGNPQSCPVGDRHLIHHLLHVFMYSNTL